MRDYAKVRAAFWTGRTGRAIRRLIPPERRLTAWVVATYLITNRHANMIGLYEMPIPFLAHEIGIDEDEALDAIAALGGLQFCDYDPDAEVVWVFEMARFQILKDPDGALEPRDNQVKGVANVYGNLPENRFLGPFFDRYAEAFHMIEKRGTGQQVLPFVEGPSAGSPQGATEGASKGPTKSGAGAGAGAGEKDSASPMQDARITFVPWGERPLPRETKLAAARKVDPNAIEVKVRGKARGILWGQSRAMFDEFWDAFGYKRGRLEAISAWLSLEEDGVLDPEVFGTRIMPAARAECAWRKKQRPVNDGGPTPKMAEGWLSTRRFEDEDLIGEDPKREQVRATARKQDDATRRLNDTIARARAAGVDDLDRRDGETVEAHRERLEGEIADVRLNEMKGGG